MSCNFNKIQTDGHGILTGNFMWITKLFYACHHVNISLCIPYEWQKKTIFLDINLLFMKTSHCIFIGSNKIWKFWNELN